MDNHGSIGNPGRILVTLISFLCCVSVCVLPGCSPKIIEKVKTEYVYQDVHHYDTTYTKDSVYIREWLKGDTVYLEKYKDRYIFRDRWRDSISIKEVHDTTTVEKKVEKELTTGQKIKINSFWYLLIALLGFAVWTFRKPILSLLKLL